MFCASCGTKISPDAAFCPACGKKVDPGNDEAEGKGESQSRDAGVSQMGRNSRSAMQLFQSVVRILWRWVVAIVVALLLGVWWSEGVSPVEVIASFISAPPVRVEVRQGVLSDAVVQVTNTSDREIIVCVRIYRENQYDIATKRISAHSRGEFGALEFKGGWKSRCGDKGFVHVNGFRRVVVFELGDGSYSARIEYGVPDDFPGKESSTD